VGIASVVLPGPIGLLFTQGPNFGHFEAIDEDIVLAHFLQDLDIGAVESADRDGAIQRQLHVAGSRCFGSGGRDLLAQIGGGNDLLRQRDAIVGYECHLDPLVGPRIAVDHSPDVVDQLNNLLREPIAGRGFSRENIGPRHSGLKVILDQGQVLVNDVHHVEQLPLIGVDPLYLNIEQGIGVDFQPGGILDDSRQFLLIRTLDFLEVRLKACIRCMGFEFPQSIEVGEPAFSVS
jgi:hypothetical protein